MEKAERERSEEEQQNYIKNKSRIIRKEERNIKGDKEMKER